MLLICFRQTGFAQDTLSVIKPHKQHFKAEPLKATMLAVALPGAGQIYNRKFWKIPVVYAGFGVLFYSAGVNAKNYTLYIQAYQDFTDVIPETDSYIPTSYLLILRLMILSCIPKLMIPPLPHIMRMDCSRWWIIIKDTGIFPILASQPGILFQYLMQMLMQVFLTLM